MEKSPKSVSGDMPPTVGQLEVNPMGQPQTYQDEDDMIRLGKRQEYNRNFGLISTMGFAAVFSDTWEYVLLSTGGALIDGGFAGL